MTYYLDDVSMDPESKSEVLSVAPDVEEEPEVEVEEGVDEAEDEGEDEEAADVVQEVRNISLSPLLPR